MADRAFDVVVIGLGPVGCLATYLLARQGLRVAAVEQEQAVYRLPRAVMLDGEIIRAFQPHGTAEALFERLQKVRPGDRTGFCDSQHNFLFGHEVGEFSSNGWQTLHMFDQPELETFLRDLALAQTTVTNFVGWTAGRPDQDGRRATVTVSHGSEKQTLSADWLIACDGASSPVRKHLGIEWQDLGYNQDWLVVDVEVRDGHTLQNTTLQVCDPDRIQTYVCTKDPYRRWEFRLNPGETWEEMLHEETIYTLIDPWTPRDTYSIRRAAMYTFHAATAERWREGRIMIAGDAAHQTPPFLGQGMNTGMRDVINLAWKLPLVQSGTADSSLLETYESERIAHAHDFVEWAVSIGRLMEHLAETEAATRANRAPPEMPAALKASGYGQGRGAPPLRAGILIEEQIAIGTTGHPYRQPMVSDGTRTFRFDEVLGPGFAVITPTHDDATLSPDSAALLERLQVPVIATEDYALVAGKYTAPDRTILVRPDRYVFGHTTPDLDADALIARLARALSLRD